MDIPDVAFRSADSVQENIGLVDLNDLYQRKGSMDHDPESPHRVSFHMLLHFQRGSGSHFIDFQHYPFQDDSFIFIHKQQVHAFDLSKQPEGMAILFTDEFVNQLQTNMRVPLFTPMHPVFRHDPVFVPDPDLSTSCSSLFVEIRKEMSRAGQDSLILMSLFSSLLLMLARATPGQNLDEAASRIDKRFHQFSSLLEDNYLETRDASDYAEKMHMTYKHLNDICKRNTGKTAKQLIDIYVVLEAKRRLALTRQSIQQLSFDMGFEDTSNFVKYFKRHANETPSRFQKRTLAAR